MSWHFQIISKLYWCHRNISIKTPAKQSIIESNRKGNKNKTLTKTIEHQRLGDDDGGHMLSHSYTCSSSVALEPVHTHPNSEKKTAGNKTRYEDGAKKIEYSIEIKECERKRETSQRTLSTEGSKQWDKTPVFRSFAWWWLPRRWCYCYWPKKKTMQKKNKGVKENRTVDVQHRSPSFRFVRGVHPNRRDIRRTNERPSKRETKRM